MQYCHDVSTIAMPAQLLVSENCLCLLAVCCAVAESRNVSDDDCWSANIWPAQLQASQTLFSCDLPAMLSSCARHASSELKPTQNLVLELVSLESCCRCSGLYFVLQNAAVTTAVTCIYLPLCESCLILYLHG